jgi:hypothetical protein
MDLHVAEVSQDCGEEAHIRGHLAQTELRGEEIEQSADVRWRSRVVDFS